MKHVTKILAVILVTVIALSTTACSLTPQWSYADGENQLSIGTYIYAMHNAYSQAESYAKETDVYDSEAGTYDGKKSFLEVKITDEDGNEAVAQQWIKDETDKTMKTLLTIDKEFERLSCEIDDEAMANHKATAKEYWEYGPYYSMYGEQYISPYKDLYEPLGVSYESFEYFYLTSAKQQVIFDTLYKEGGEKAVAEKELKEYFTENYTSYVYFNTNLYTSTQETSEDGQSLSKNEALSKKEIKKIEDQYKGYVEDIKAGDSVEDVAEKMMKDQKLDSDPSVKAVEPLENSSIGEDLVAAIEELKEGEASYKIIGEKDSQVIYFFYKEPIDNQVKNYIKDEANVESVLQNFKGEEFQTYIDDLAKALKPEINEKAIKKYTPAFFEENAQPAA